MKLNFGIFISRYFLNCVEYILQTFSAKFYPHREPGNSCFGNFILKLFIFARLIIFVIWVGFIIPLFFYTLKRAWDINNENWGIENLGEKESSSNTALMIMAYLVHTVWYMIICILILWLSILTCVLAAYCKNPANVEITPAERPISQDLVERLGSWFVNRPSFLPKLTPTYTANI